MYSREDQLIFMNYLQKLIEKPRRIQDQPHTRDGRFLWCEDWEIIEVLKYFFNGHEGYMGDPPPNRLKDNPLWSKEQIVAYAKQLLEENKTPDAIIEALKTRRGV